MFDMHFANGQTGRTMHNEYPVLYQKANRAGDPRLRADAPDRQTVVLQPDRVLGQARLGGIRGRNVPGDEATNWGQAAGLASLAPDMLNRAVGGAYGFATDIGGYYDYTTPPTTKELLLRWAEWSALSPVFRLHGSGRAGTHTPWSYDAQTVQIYNAISRLHERAAPLILQVVEGRPTGPGSRPLGRCGSRSPAIGARPPRNRSGCSARTCSWRRSSRREHRAGASTSPGLLAGSADPSHLPRPAERDRHGAAGEAAVLLPVRRAAVLIRRG